MAQSILTSTKKILGIAQSDTSFDVDIVIHINSVFSVLQQLGVGPSSGFSIVDATANWEDFLGTSSNAINAVKTYMYLRVRLLFDAPTTSYLVASLNEQIKELEWRLNVVREETNWVSPTPVEPSLMVYDGGEP
jgi:hypothetical protein